MTPSTPQPETAEQFYDDDDDGFAKQLPGRQRFTFLSPLTAGLISLIVGGVGFFVGVRVERSKVGSSGGGAQSFASRLTGATGSGSRTGAFGAGEGAGGAGGAGTGAAGSTGARAAGFASLFGRGGAGTSGSVTAIDGDTLYVKEASGNTVKVKLTNSTTVTKSESVSKKKIFPGDEVTISGPAGSAGAVNATAVTDSGTGGAGGTAGGGAAGSTASGSGSSSSSSAVSSLFGG